MSEHQNLYCSCFSDVETLLRPGGPRADRGPLARIVSQHTKPIRTKMKGSLVRRTENTNDNKGFGHPTWLQASQLEADLVCAVSQNTKNSESTNENEGFVAQTHQK